MGKLRHAIASLWGNDIFRYVFFGGCSTLVNLASYYALRFLTPWDYNVINVISVSLAIIFAFFVNSWFVFRSKAEGFKEHFHEFIKFVSARLSTMVIEVGGVFVLVEVLGMNDMLAKFLTQFIVIALNYLFSKFLVFTKK